MTDAALPIDSSSPAPEEATPRESLSPFDVLGGVLLRPKATFTTMRNARRGHWWLAFVIAVIALILFSVANGLAQAPSLQEFSPPPGEISGGDVRPVGGISPLIFIVPPIIFGTIGTLFAYGYRSLVMFTMSMALGGKASFQQILRMSAWTLLPAAIRQFIGAGASFINGEVTARGISAYLTTAEVFEMPMLNAILSPIDIYLIWSMLLLWVGIVATAKIDKRKGVIAVLVYLVISLIGLLIYGAIRGAMMNFGGPGGPG